MTGLLRILAFLVVGFGVGAVLGYFYVLLFSENRQQRDLEAAMTSMFFFGPIGALIGLIAALLSKIGR